MGLHRAGARGGHGLRSDSVSPEVGATGRIARRAVRAALDQPPTLGDSDCEALHAGFFTQPVNTITSTPFIGIGGWLAARTASLRPEHRPAAAAFAAVVAMNGVGSVAYHGPQFPGSQTLHDLPIYAMAAMGAGVPVLRRYRGVPALPGWTSVRGVGIVVVGALGAASYVGGRTASRVCDPDSWMQFHGLWHLSTAALAAAWATVLWPRHPPAAPDPDAGARAPHAGTRTPHGGTRAPHAGTRTPHGGRVADTIKGSTTENGRGNRS